MAALRQLHQPRRLRDRHTAILGIRGACGVRSSVFEAVDGRAGIDFEPFLEAGERRFDPAEPCVDVLPSRRDQIDEQREVVHTVVPLGVRLSLERLEAPDHLIRQPPDLRKLTSDRQHLLAEAVLDSGLDARRQCRSRLRRSIRERRELGA